MAQVDVQMEAATSRMYLRLVVQVSRCRHMARVPYLSLTSSPRPVGWPTPGTALYGGRRSTCRRVWVREEGTWAPRRRRTRREMRRKGREGPR